MPDPLDAKLHRRGLPDTKLVEHAKRWTFTAREKPRILQEGRCVHEARRAVAA